MSHVPPQPANSIRIVLELNSRADRLDTLLMDAFRKHASLDLRNVSRMGLKKLFSDKRIVIKNQAAKPASAIAAGKTYVDILGFSD